MLYNSQYSHDEFFSAFEEYFIYYLLFGFVGILSRNMRGVFKCIWHSCGCHITLKVDLYDNPIMRFVMLLLCTDLDLGILWFFCDDPITHCSRLFLDCNIKSIFIFFRIYDVLKKLITSFVQYLTTDCEALLLSMADTQ